jgi:hypothetical protein
MSHRKYFKNKQKNAGDRQDLGLIGAPRKACSKEHTLTRQCYRCQHTVYVRPVTENHARQVTKTVSYICEVCFALPDAAKHYLDSTE